MPTHETLLAFTVVSACLMPVPGPSNVFIATQGVTRGRRAALAATLGIAAASAIRVLVAATGLLALLASLPGALLAIKWLGVAYLAVLAVRALRRPRGSRDADDDSGTAARCSMRRGLVVGLANPKMLVFFLAFFPQFIDPSRGPAATQVLLLGAIFWVLGTLWDLGLAIASGALGRRLDRRPRHSSVPRRLEGLTYVALAGWICVSGA